ncbi:MAG: hypothetical protein IK048_01805 [Clostridia bacterium]|nr:hypothetical protein [Clostridia bacterium]
MKEQNELLREKAIFDDEDLRLDENIFDGINSQNEEFIGANAQNKQSVMKIIEQVEMSTEVPRESDEAKEKQGVEVKENDDAQVEKEQQKEERKYGKFKTPEELLHAYGELEKEFTRRSQRLKELESASSEPFKNDEDWKEAVDKFFSETPSAKVFAKDIAAEIISHPELKQDKNCLNIALTRALVSRFRTPEQLMQDGQFLKDYVLTSKEVKDAVIAEYLRGIRAGEPPFTLGGGGRQFASAPKSPKTLEEAGFMFLKDNE